MKMVNTRPYAVIKHLDGNLFPHINKLAVKRGTFSAGYDWTNQYYYGFPELGIYLSQTGSTGNGGGYGSPVSERKISFKFKINNEDFITQNRQYNYKIFTTTPRVISNDQWDNFEPIYTKMVTFAEQERNQQRRMFAEQNRRIRAQERETARLSAISDARFNKEMSQRWSSLRSSMGGGNAYGNRNSSITLRGNSYTPRDYSQSVQGKYGFKDRNGKDREFSSVAESRKAYIQEWGSPLEEEKFWREKRKQEREQQRLNSLNSQNKKYNRGANTR